MQAQDAAARAEPVEVRALEQLADLRGVDALFESVWGTGIPILGVELLRALSHEDGYVSGAFLRGGGNSSAPQPDSSAIMAIAFPFIPT